MTDWPALLKVTIALFAIVNPIGSIPIFISATDGWSRQERAKTAKTVAITVFIVLAVSAFLGDKILDFFGISIPSFQVGGGILLMLIAISMMHGKQSGTRQTPEEAQTMAERNVIAIVPLSIPLLAGPGAISSMIIAAQQTSSFTGHLSLIAPIFIIAIIIWLVLRLAVGISLKLGTIGINIVTRLMGLILAAMAVEFVAHGLIGLFPKLAS
ncbi:MarC family protein [Methylotenera sp.]|uniref:MarC family protein n=1 Tax=Methylotenera sp. TaxID=2051956 RepID=UPI0027212DE0|nr:MarC family protein [Methylotenera sp.]MDO9205188.1 MarC family protein [Methylotenera sp.]MDP2071813.1 MarC family protein [Methylotenera sp.]MDP3005479.1 MarC family protein [Methylotenera sp.]MDP3308068.1 MarC family protein [Methylotenera sp.]MDP3818220.1 MarC family protein [Methylotenera sp.]